MAQRKRVESRNKSGKKATGKATVSPKKTTDSSSRLQKARKLVAQALHGGDCRQEIVLAGEALQLSEDCAEAYLIFATHTFHAIDALPFFEQARAAAARNLGPDFFKKKRGKFWSNKATQPYMQACGGFAECLWSVGRREDAITIWQEMLTLDQLDHQGSRFLLQSALLELQQTANAMEVLERYAEPSTSWDYNLLLASFQQSGDSEVTRNLLKQARKRNKHVVLFLLKDKLPKEELSELAKPGSSEEGALYAEGGSAAWWQTPGAITWLRQTASRKGQSARSLTASVGPTEESKQRLRELTQKYGVVYQAAVHQFPVWTTEGSQHVRPWVIVMVDYNDRQIVAQEMLSHKPSTAAVWDRIEQGMREPFAGKPSRPSEIQVYEHPVWEELRPHFQEIGIDVIYRQPVDEIDFILRQLQPVFSNGPPESGLLSERGITLQLAASFYAAAADFFRSAPWQYCSDDRALEIRFPKDHGRPCYATVLGQGGDTYGLALHEDVEAILDLWSGVDPTDDADHIGITVQFGEPFELTAVDVDAIEKHNWPVATPEAYPSVLRTDPELLYCPPSANDLKRIIYCLRAIPEFARRNFRKHRATATLTVTLGSAEPACRGKAKSKRLTAGSHEVQIKWLEEDIELVHDHDHDHGDCGDTSCSDHDHDDCNS